MVLTITRLAQNIIVSMRPWEWRLIVDHIQVDPERPSILPGNVACTHCAGTIVRNENCDLGYGGCPDYLANQIAELHQTHIVDAGATS